MTKKNGAMTMSEAGPSRTTTKPGLFSGGFDLGRLLLEGAPSSR